MAFLTTTTAALSVRDTIRSVGRNRPARLLAAILDADRAAHAQTAQHARLTVARQLAARAFRRDLGRIAVLVARTLTGQPEVARIAGAHRRFAMKAGDTVEHARQAVLAQRATRLGPAHPLEPFSLVFLDPPYGKGLAEKALHAARDGDWLKPGALIVVEEATSAAFTAPAGFDELERRPYDDTEVIFLRCA